VASPAPAARAVTAVDPEGLAAEHGVQSSDVKAAAFSRSQGQKRKNSK
jgi:hypothetical protein